MNVTVRNVILSMSLMSALDWTEFFEAVSLVDEVLHEGPNYAAMDFATRDAYRHAVEELARGSGQHELRVARAAVARARREAEADDARRPIPASISSATGAWPSSGRSATERRPYAGCFGSM